MFVSTGRVKARTSFAEIAKRLEAGMVPILRRAPGFLGFYVLQTDDSTGAGTVVYQSEKDWNGVKEEVFAWFEKNVEPLTVGEPVVIEGEVIVSIEVEADAARASAAPPAEARPH